MSHSTWRRLVHQWDQLKVKESTILSSFTHPDLYDFLSSVERKRRSFEECWYEQLLVATDLHSLEKKNIMEPPWTVWSSAFFKISYFVFNRRKECVKWHKHVGFVHCENFRMKKLCVVEVCFFQGRGQLFRGSNEIRPHCSKLCLLLLCSWSLPMWEFQSAYLKGFFLFSFFSSPLTGSHLQLRRSRVMKPCSRSG